jgi:hypothetical protein
MKLRSHQKAPAAIFKHHSRKPVSTSPMSPTLALDFLPLTLTNKPPIASTGFISVNKPHGNTTQASVGIGRSPATEGNSIPVIPRPTSGRTRGGQAQRVRSFVSPRARHAFEHDTSRLFNICHSFNGRYGCGLIDAITCMLAVFVGGPVTMLITIR